MKPIINIKADKLSVYDFFKAKNILPMLVSSVKKYGIIEPITVIKDNSGNFTVIDGISRFYCASQCGLSELPIYVLCDMTEKDIISNFIKTEIIIKISQERLNNADRILAILLYKELGMLINNRNFFENDLNIPAGVIDFLLLKDDNVQTIIHYAIKRNIPMKILAEIAESNEYVIQYISKISGIINPKQNLMRQIVSLVNDLVYAEIPLPIIDEDKTYDELSIIDELHKLRYPDFKLKENHSKEIAQKVDDIGASISFPPYFEGGFAEIKIKITGKSNLDKLKKIISSLDDKLICEVRNFLKSD